MLTRNWTVQYGTEAASSADTSGRVQSVGTGGEERACREGGVWEVWSGGGIVGEHVVEGTEDSYPTQELWHEVVVAAADAGRGGVKGRGSKKGEGQGEGKGEGQLGGDDRKGEGEGEGQ